MNAWEGIGRLVKEPTVSYTSNSNMCVAVFTLAIDRDGAKDANGNKITDFPRVTVYGRQAEIVEKYVHKGDSVAVQGRVTTGSYEKNGQTIYYTGITANRVEFIGSNKKASENGQKQPSNASHSEDIYEELQEDIPF